MRNLTTILFSMLAAASIGADAVESGVVDRGVATTVESGGYQQGCVDWTYRVVPSPRNRAARRISLEFDFVNRCGRKVYVGIASQTKAYASRTWHGPWMELAPGKTLAYAHANETGNYLIFNPDADQWLRFWIHQSDLAGNSRMLDLSRCSPKFRSKKPHPPCPPAFAVDSAGL